MQKHPGPRPATARWDVEEDPTVPQNRKNRPRLGNRTQFPEHVFISDVVIIVDVQDVLASGMLPDLVPASMSVIHVPLVAVKASPFGSDRD